MAGNITQIDRLKRMVQVRDLVETGLSDSKIALKLGMELTSVKRTIIYIKELAKAELTSKEISAKRAELYLETSDAASEARKLFDKFKEWMPCKMCEGSGFTLFTKKDKEIKKPCTNCKGMGGFIRTGDAKKFYDAWMDAIDRRMRLYGLDNVKGGDVIINPQTNNLYVPQDKVDSVTAGKLSKIIKGNHEQRIQEKYERDKEF